MRLIQGVDIIDYPIHADARGELAAFDDFDNVPFPLRRVFYLKVDDRDVARGGHANSCDELIIALSGSTVVDVDNGFARHSMRLRPGNRALWIRSGIVINLREFEPKTVLLVCASARYKDTRHFDRPQPHLFMADALV